MSRYRTMNPERKQQLWERLYFMNGFGLSDYLNDFIRIPGAHWRATQHGEYAFLQGDSGEIFRFDQWSRWRAGVTDYFDAMCDTVPGMRDETFCDVFVFKLCRILLAPLLDHDEVVVHEPSQSRKLLFC